MAFATVLLALLPFAALTGAPTKPSADEQLLLPIADRDWDPNRPDLSVGWCIETSIQMAMGFYGREVPQTTIHQAGRPAHADLYFAETDRAMTSLAVRFESWDYTQTNLDQFISWIKQQLRARHPVICAVKIYPDEHLSWFWDHAVLAVGFNSRGLYLNSNIEGQKLYTYEQLASLTNGYSFQNRLHSYFGRAVTGVGSQPAAGTSAPR